MQLSPLNIGVRHHGDGAEITVILPNGSMVTIGLDWYGEKKKMFQVICDGDDDVKATVHYGDDGNPCDVMTDLPVCSANDDEICDWLKERDGAI